MSTMCVATDYYISPRGSDSNDGLSLSTPWGTFAHALSEDGVAPGDTLIILDGIYNQSIEPTVSGRADAPITIRAQNIGGAIIQMESPGSAIRIFSSSSKTLSHIVIEGLIARGAGENAAVTVNSQDNIDPEVMTNNITIRKTGVFGSAYLTNSVALGVARSKDCLIEDVWVYGAARSAMSVFGALRITVRRAVLRYDHWDGADYKPNDPRLAFTAYNTQDSLFENLIALDSAETPEGRGGDRVAFAAA